MGNIREVIECFYSKYHRHPSIDKVGVSLERLLSEPSHPLDRQSLGFQEDG